MRFGPFGDEFWVNTENAAGQRQDFKVEYTFGVTPLQQYLIPFPGGRLQALNICWDTRPREEGGQRWFHLYPNEEIPPDDMLQVERRIYGKTKFDRMVRWGCANLFYVVAPVGLIEAEELPVSWGLLLAAELDGEGIPSLELVKKPHLIDVPPERRLDLLQRIAGSGTRMFNR